MEKFSRPDKVSKKCQVQKYEERKKYVDYKGAKVWRVFSQINFSIKFVPLSVI